MRLLLAFFLVFTATGCEAQRDEDRSSDDRNVEARAVTGDALLDDKALDDETIAIVTTDDRFRLALTDSELRMGVTEAFVEQIEEEVVRRGRRVERIRTDALGRHLGRDAGVH